MKPRQRLLGVSFLSLLFLVGLALITPDRCLASAFKVTPVKVLLSQRASTALLTLTNESDRRLRFQASVFRWDQTREGKMELTPTRDVVFFPPILSVEPGETRKVRLGSAGPFGPSEKSYRIFFEELPELDSAGNDKGSQLFIRTRMGIPIFFQPEEKEPGTRFDSVAAAAGILHFSVRNTGNVHVNLRGVRVKGLSDSGSPLFEREAEGWYVLAGGTRDYAIEIPAERCGEVNRFVIEALVDEATIVENLEPSAVFCR